MSFWSVCCGSKEKEKKGAVVAPFSDESENTLNSDRRSKKEEQIALVNKSKERSKSFLGVDKEGRETIRTTPLNFDEDFQPPVYAKTPEQVSFLQNVLQQNFIFMDLSEEELRMLVDAMQCETAKEGSTIIKQGDVGDYFYVVESGEIDFLDKEEKVGSSGAAACFGELALLYDCPRAVSCLAASEQVVLWKVDQTTFRHLLARHSRDDHRETKELVRKISMFKDLDDATISRFIDGMTLVNWNRGDRIVQKGETGSVFYIVDEGEVRVHDIGLGESRFEDQILKSGGWFGERALLTGEPRAANVTALTDVKTLAMDRDTFEKTVGQLKNLLEREMRKRNLSGLPMIANSDLTGPELGQLSDQMKEITYSKGAKLLEAGKSCDKKLWIIRKGSMIVYDKDTEKMFSLKSGDHYGSKTLRDDPKRLCTENAIVEEELTAWVLTRDDIENVIGLIDRLGMAAKLNKDPHHVSSRCSLSDLTKYRVLGQGAFGKVWLVSFKDKKEPHALKIIGKRKLLDSKQEQGVVREKELLCLLKHPFILNLESAFQDENNLYLLLPLIPGGELFSVLHRKENRKRGGGLPNNDAAFYSACITEALGHFHQRFIAYRDLKLENILIDEMGYGKVVDLGFAKVVVDKTFTLVGTPEYLAPEVIMSKGHDKAVDWWSFGVLVYELLVGVSPFYARGSSQIEMFKRIVLGKYKIPDKVDGNAAGLIKKLLVRRSTQRLGNLSKGHLDVKNHAWFGHSEIDFTKILKKEQPAPWVPEVKDPFDCSNFDDFGTEEAENNTAKPLTKAEQKIFDGF